MRFAGDVLMAGFQQQFTNVGHLRDVSAPDDGMLAGDAKVRIYGCL
jgi:hypothetical protein